MNAKFNSAEHCSSRKRQTADEYTENRERAFTVVDLLAVIAVLAVLAIIVLPAMGRSNTNSSVARCSNNFRQLGAAWTMYNGDNSGSLVASYPNFGGFTGSWCGGNASSSGSAGSYTYGGADPRGITNALLWPFLKSLTPYKCPADKRVVPVGVPSAGEPILRSVSMNSYMAGTSFGVTPSFVITSPTGPRNPNTPVYLKENEIARPSSTFVFIDEDDASINDGMFIVDMGGTRGLLDCPARRHENGYTINFADTHVEYIKIKDPQTLQWFPSSTSWLTEDWKYLTNVATAPLMK